MIQTITFTSSEVSYGKSAKEQLAEWSKDISKDQVISIQFHDGGKITVFYWNY